MITKDIFANYEQCTECQSTLQNEYYICGMYFYIATKQRTVKSLYYCLIVTYHFIQTIFETWRENATVTDRLPDRFARRIVIQSSRHSMYYAAVIKFMLNRIMIIILSSRRVDCFSRVCDRVCFPVLIQAAVHKPHSLNVLIKSSAPVATTTVEYTYVRNSSRNIKYLYSLCVCVCLSVFCIKQ